MNSNILPTERSLEIITPSDYFGEIELALNNAEFSNPCSDRNFRESFGFKESYGLAVSMQSGDLARKLTSSSRRWSRLLEGVSPEAISLIYRDKNSSNAFDRSLKVDIYNHNPREWLIDDIFLEAHFLQDSLPQPSTGLFNSWATFHQNVRGTPTSIIVAEAATSLYHCLDGEVLTFFNRVTDNKYVLVANNQALSQ